MSARGGVMATLVIAVLGIAVASYAQAPAAAPPPAPAVPPAETAPHFSHVAHAAVKAANVAQCAQCHGLGTDDRPLLPGADGHQPCMKSGCHLADFLDPQTKLCLGCHVSTDNFRKNPTIDVYGADATPEHVMEMNHEAHMQRGQPGQPSTKTTCQTCHWVDKTTFVAVTHPGHAQCATCHGTSSKLPMSSCDSCHQNGDPSVAFAKHRRDAHLNGKFKHEHVGHRFFDKDAKQRPIQCDTCHGKIGHLDTLAQVFATPMVDTATMKNTCAKCHDVRDVKNCEQCHTRSTVVKTFNYHGL